MPEELLEIRQSINRTIDLAREIDALLEMASLELAGIETQRTSEIK